jgi:hypothetical protein
MASGLMDGFLADHGVFNGLAGRRMSLYLDTPITLTQRDLEG